MTLDEKDDQHNIPNITTLKGKRYTIRLESPLTLKQLPYGPLHDDLTLRYRLYSGGYLLDIIIVSNDGFHKLSRPAHEKAVCNVLQKADDYFKEVLKNEEFFNCTIVSTLYHEEYTFPSSSDESSTTDDEN